MGMAICNDRRWPETYRAMSLQGAELIMLGYNTGSVRRTMVGNHQVQEPAHLSSFHNHLVMQAGAYQNCCWVVGVAKAGMEEGVEFMGGSCIIAPTGDIVAQAVTTGTRWWSQTATSISASTTAARRSTSRPTGRSSITA